MVLEDSPPIVIPAFVFCGATIITFVSFPVCVCCLKSELEHYKFVEDIYYNFTLICDNNNVITIETSIDKKYNENNINEIDKFILNILILFIENNYTSYVKNEIFKKKLNKINLHSFVLNIT